MRYFCISFSINVQRFLNSCFDFVIMAYCGWERKHLFNPFWIQAVTTQCGISQGVWTLSEGTVHVHVYCTVFHSRHGLWMDWMGMDTQSFSVVATFYDTDVWHLSINVMSSSVIMELTTTLSDIIWCLWSISHLYFNPYLWSSAL